MPKERKTRKDGAANPRLIERTIKAYVALRDEKSKLRKEYDTKVDLVEEKIDKLSAVLRDHMDGAGLESVRSKSGTAFKTYKEYVSVESWDSLLGWVVESEAWHFFIRNVSKTAVKEYMEENSYLPPGVKYERELEIQVRRPS